MKDYFKKHQIWITHKGLNYNGKNRILVIINFEIKWKYFKLGKWKKRNLRKIFLKSKRIWINLRKISWISNSIFKMLINIIGNTKLVNRTKYSKN